jgi:hypothetical protein
MTTVQTRVGAFVWHECLTSDSARAQSFYAELLGWEIEVWKPGELDYSMIKVGDATHGGFWQAEGGIPSHWLGHVCVEDVDAAAARVEPAGGSILRPRMEVPEVGAFVIVQDPQGAVVSIYQAETEPPASEGVFVWDELLTDDVEAAKAFYGAVYGWTAEEMDLEGGGSYTLFNRNDGSNVAGCMAKPSDMAAPSMWIPYMGTDDIDATAAKATSLGAAVYMTPFDVAGVGRVAVLGDPTGATFGLFKPAS